MISVFKVLIALSFIIFLAENSIHAERVYTDSDLKSYGEGSSDSTSGGSDMGTNRGSSDTEDESKAIQLCENAIRSGITVYGRYSGVKSVKLKDLTPSSKAKDLVYIISFDAHLDHDIISPVECWVYRKNGQLTYRITSKE
jgi:hypothetical protein